MSNIIKLKRGLESSIPSNLSDGELVLTTDTNKLFTNNGEIAPESVAVSVNEPTDTDVQVWINPNGKSDLTELVERVNNLENNIRNYWNIVYPVGSIYISATYNDPGNLFGGVWTQFAKGRTLVGVDTQVGDPDLTTVLKTGGEYFHTITVEEIPSHNHSFRAVKDVANTDSGGGLPKANNAQGNNYGWSDWGSQDADYAVNYEGGGQSHNNMQPYITVYMWRRLS